MVLKVILKLVLSAIGRDYSNVCCYLVKTLKHHILTISLKILNSFHSNQVLYAQKMQLTPMVQNTNFAKKKSEISYRQLNYIWTFRSPSQWRSHDSTLDISWRFGEAISWLFYEKKTFFFLKITSLANKGLANKG